MGALSSENSRVFEKGLKGNKKMFKKKKNTREPDLNFGFCNRNVVSSFQGSWILVKILAVKMCQKVSISMWCAILSCVNVALV